MDPLIRLSRHLLGRMLGRGATAGAVQSTKRSAQVWLRQGVHIVHPWVGSAGGDPCFFSEPVVVLGGGVESAILGEAVLSALDASHHHAPWPTDWKALARPLHAAAGVGSERVFQKGAINVRVDLQDGVLTICPSTSNGTDKGSEAFPDRALRLDVGSAREIGDAVRRCLELSD